VIGGRVQDSELLLANEALNALTTQIAVLDSDGRIVFVNDGWTAFAGRNGGGPDAGAYLGVDYLQVCQDAIRRGDSSAALALAGLEKVLQGHQAEFSLEYPCNGPDQDRWFRMSITGFVSGTGRFLVVAHEDITIPKQNERAMQASERLLRAVLGVLPIGVWIMDSDGRIMEGNPAGKRIWAGARYVGPEDFGEYKGWWLNTGEPISAEDWAAARAIRHGETSIDEEIEIECFDGTHKIILNSALPLRESDGRVMGAIIVNQDITARKRGEAEREALLLEHERLRIAAQEANRMKDVFIATLSHELRTPLNSILGWAAILKRSSADAACERPTAAIERNARIAAQLLNDALDLDRIARGQLTLAKTDVDFARLVSEVIDTLRPAAAEKGVSLVEQLGDAKPPVHGDALRLQQILWNLLGNALKFTEAEGRIEVRMAVVGAWIELSVRDTGVGIAPEFLPFVFHRFRQGAGSLETTRMGLGLGLAIVKELAQMHGGTIAVESPGIGKGATFTLRLPVARHDGSSAEAS
jgi:signal transduction histidine kinase